MLRLSMLCAHRDSAGENLSTVDDENVLEHNEYIILGPGEQKMSSSCSRQGPHSARVLRALKSALVC